jgi:hypothetical protein
MWNEVVMAVLKAYPSICIEGLKEQQKTQSKYFCEISTQYVRSTGCYTNLLSLCHVHIPWDIMTLLHLFSALI